LQNARIFDNFLSPNCHHTGIFCLNQQKYLSAFSPKSHIRKNFFTILGFNVLVKNVHQTAVSIRGVCVACHDHMCEQSVVMKFLLSALWSVYWLGEKGKEKLFLKKMDITVKSQQRKLKLSPKTKR